MQAMCLADGHNSAGHRQRRGARFSNAEQVCGAITYLPENGRAEVKPLYAAEDLDRSLKQNRS